MKPVLALLSLLAVAARAQTPPGVPAVLFDVFLGAVYEYPADGTDENAVGTFPVKRLLSERSSLHRGVSLYFEPLNEEAAFPFRDTETESSASPMSSYRLFVYPVLPEDDAPLAELRERNLPQRVFMVEWSQGDGRRSDAYVWAIDLCKSIEAESGIAPEVTDTAESDVYRCVFSDGERELEVSSVVGRTIQLSFADAISDETEAAVYTRIRRLELEERRKRILGRR